MTQATDMPVTAIAPWFGGKRTLAPLIVSELGPHRAYWEPFCGSMSVLMVKPPCQHEYVNDLHGELFNLAAVIQSPVLGPQFYRALRRVWMAEDLVKAAKLALAAGVDDPLQRAVCYFIESWIGRNGVSGTFSTNASFCIRYTSGGGSAAKRLTSAVESIPAWRRRMRNVCISNRDAFELLEKIQDAKGTAIYCDPPYLVKGARYIHDFKPEDHERLARSLARFHKARVLVSYYEDPRLADLYPAGRWTKRSVAVSKAMAHQGARGANDVQAPEVLLINGPSLSTVAGGLSLFEKEGPCPK